MFPLGTVVFPYTAVPLRVFEARYQHLLDDVLGGDRTFGTVLIERGSEVGGGDQRFDVGCRVRVISVSRLAHADHRSIIVAGTDRIAIDAWVDEEPYPSADVTDMVDADEPVDGSLIDEVGTQVRRVLALASELGADTSQISTDLEGDPLLLSYQVAALTPVTPLDAYRLLVASGPADRLEIARQMLVESADLLRAQLGESE